MAAGHLNAVPLRHWPDDASWETREKGRAGSPGKDPAAARPAPGAGLGQSEGVEKAPPPGRGAACRRPVRPGRHAGE